jgi:hypothetical protein
MGYNKRKVYWKGLILVLRQLIRYINRNNSGLQNNLDGPTYACVTALLEAADICLAALPENTPS